MHGNHCDPILVARSIATGRMLALVIVALGLLVLNGWLFDNAALKSVLPGWATMKANTALGFLAAGGALHASVPRPGASLWHHAQPVLAAAVALLGLLTLGQYLSGISFGIDQLLFPDSSASHAAPERMAFATALAFATTGLALLLQQRWHLTSHCLALAGFLIGLLAIMVYLYDQVALSGLQAYSSVALHTALGLLALNLGILFIQPQQGLMALVTNDASGGLMARRLLPYVIVGPLLIGWLRIEGERRGYVSAGLGIALVSLVYVILLTCLILHTAAILRASDQKLHHLYQLSPLGFVLTDMQGRYIESNAAFQRMDAMMPATNTLFVNDAVQQLTRSGTYGPYEKETMRDDGSRLSLRLNGVGFNGGAGKNYVWSIVEDVTEQKKAEAKRLAETLFHRQLMEQLPIGVGLHTLSGDFIDANQAFAEILGLPRAQIAGISNAQASAPEFHAQDAEQAELLQRTGRYGPYEKEYARPDGARVPVRVRGQHVERNGETLILSVAEDITDKRKAEFRLAQAQKMDAIGQLTGGLAHDFNNMLGVIIGNLDLLSNELDGDSAARGRVDTALMAALRGADLTRALLAVARTQSVVAEPVDLNLRLMELLPLLRHTAGPDIDVNMALADDPVVQVDAGGLSSTLLNLVINARDAMPGGGRLTLSTCVRTVTPDEDMATLAPGRYAALSVTDTGSGMSREVMASAMLPFFTTKERGRGTGLGLAMAHGFVQQCCGELLLYSEAGHGTTVKLILPLADADAIDAGAASLAVQQDAVVLPRGAERVLVVDDEIELLAVTAKWLKLLGYDVTPCTSAPSALAALADAQAEGLPYALMVSDVIMPGMDGFALAHAARARQPGLALLYVSGFADGAERGREWPLGDILEKPFRQAELATQVRSVLDRQSVAPD